MKITKTQLKQIIKEELDAVYEGTKRRVRPYRSEEDRMADEMRAEEDEYKYHYRDAISQEVDTEVVARAADAIGVSTADLMAALESEGLTVVSAAEAVPQASDEAVVDNQDMATFAFRE